jgi:type II secretory pathway component PulF
MTHTVDRLLLAIGLAAATVPLILGYLVLPQFTEVFRNFGTKLPPTTSLLINYPFLLALFPLLVLGVWITWPTKNNRGIVACVLGSFGMVAMIALMTVAMYLPIHRLAAQA